MTYGVWNNSQAVMFYNVGLVSVISHYCDCMCITWRNMPSIGVTNVATCNMRHVARKQYQQSHSSLPVTAT